MTKLLSYPFDSKLLMRKQKELRRVLLAKEGLVEKRIAVLGGSTTHDIIGMMELFLLENGIRPTFYESGYARFYEDAVFGNEELDAFKPDIVFVHTSSHNISVWPEIDMGPEEINELFDQTIERFEDMWTNLAGKFRCPIVQNNIEYVPYRILGNLDAVEIHGRINFINRLNARFAKWAQTHGNFFINDINWQSADLGLSKWHDQSRWYLYKSALSLDAVPTLAFNVANIIKSLFGKNKKVIALDLDNTLWGGIVGDDGAENLDLGMETPSGQAYTDFQKYLKCLARRGILLGIISKNEEAAAKSGLDHPQMILKEDDFVSIKANWLPKSQNLIAMARELSLLPESFVFVDDNPAEREIVTQQVPGCAVLELDTVENFVTAVDCGGYFEATALSHDDLKRNEMYRNNAMRVKLQKSFSDYGEYLKSLDMHAEIKPFEAVYMGRIAQLTNKSNQFNLTTRRYTQQEVEAIAADDRYIAIYGALTDKFGDNGVVAISIGELKGDVCELVLWLMSCRVLKRDMEYAMMDAMVDAARSKHTRMVRGIYIPTAKNTMVKDFYATMGFTKISEDESGKSVWELDIADDYVRKNKFIAVNVL